MTKLVSVSQLNKIKMLRFLFAVVILTLLDFHGIEAQENEGEPCSLSTGASGVCRLLNKCPSVYRDLLNGKSPDTLCGFTGYDPIVCCPRASVTHAAPFTQKMTSGPTTLSTVTQSTDDASPFTTEPSIQSRNPGHLARQKCAEYARSVYALVEPPTLSVTRKLVNVSLCAINSRKLIVGGTKAEPKEFPHMTAVGFNSRSVGIVWLCGGTLVSENFVMTAAHCTYSLEYGNAVRVRVGDLNLERSDDDAKPQERGITERLRHPLYKKPAEYHDIALLRMDKPVTFDAYVRPACLPTSSHSEGSQAIATGWGRVDWTDEEGSSDLLKVTLATVPNRRCNASFSGRSVDYKLKRGIVDDWQICAGGEGRDTCQGDSGGPLVVFDPQYDCMYDVVGITSLGRLCGSIVPGVYTRVYYYIDWLENTMWRT